MGNVEYKLKLIDPSPARLEGLVTQLKWRLAEGCGEAIYEIGVEDDGSLRGISDDEMNASLKTLKTMCDRLDASMLVRHRRRVPVTRSHQRRAEHRTVAEVVVRMLADQSKCETRIAFLGCTQAGKSTLVAALSTGQRDDGCGSARTLVMRHMHELESGTTSSISQQVVGFDEHGALLNSADATFGTSSAADVVERAVGIATLLDLCGQPTYLKTTLYGLTAHVPDVVLLAVRADEPCGPDTTAGLHAALAAALHLPCVVVITRADAATDEQIANSSREVLKLLLEHGYPCPTLVHSKEQLENVRSRSGAVDMAQR